MSLAAEKTRSGFLLLTLMILAHKNNNRAIDRSGKVVIPTGPMIKGSRPFYWILLKEANL